MFRGAGDPLWSSTTVRLVGDGASVWAVVSLIVILLILGDAYSRCFVHW